MLLFGYRWLGRPFWTLHLRGRWATWRTRAERGQAMVLAALMITALIGMAGLVIDGSNLQENRRQLQNAADAAAFAGAQDLPSSPSQATTDSVQWLTKNGSGSSEVVTNAVSTTKISNDTLTVSLSRPVSTFLMQILGPGSHTVTATAKIQVEAMTGVLTSEGDFFPYDVWYENSNGTAHKIGDIVSIRSDAWVSENVGSNSNWNSTSNSFKGYSPASGGQVNVGDTIPAGTGNACGQEPISELQTYYNNNWNIVVPIVDQGSGNGSNLDVHIAGFAILSLNVPNQHISQGCGSGDFLGQIVGFAGSRGEAGGTAPQSYASCGTGIGACKAVLTQ